MFTIARAFNLSSSVNDIVFYPCNNLINLILSNDRTITGAPFLFLIRDYFASLKYRPTMMRLARLFEKWNTNLHDMAELSRNGLTFSIWLDSHDMARFTRKDLIYTIYKVRPESAICRSLFFPRDAAQNSTKYTQNTYEKHTTNIGFVAANETSPW